MTASLSESDVWLDPARQLAGTGAVAVRLSSTQVAALEVFAACSGRTVSRAELVRRSGLRDHSARRADSVLSDLRRDLGLPDLFYNVRGRGWRAGARITIVSPTAEVFRSRSAPT